MQATTMKSPNAGESRQGIVDCDVHPGPVNVDEIRGYMAQPWRGRYSGGGRGFFGNPVHGARLDSSPPSGGPPGPTPTSYASSLSRSTALLTRCSCLGRSATCTRTPTSARR
ncbi:MAG: hypothetical protein WKH64_14225 [Chloroflexia bacterium]